MRMRKVLLPILLMLFAASAALAKQQMNYYADKAEKASASQQYDDALGYARQEIADYEKNPQGYWQAAVSLYALDRKSEALAMLDKAIKHAKKDKPLTVDCHLAKSQIYEEMGDTVQAIKALSAGLKADSKNKDLLLQRAWLQANTDMKKALKDLEKAKKLYPGDAAPYVYTARIYSQRENYSVALAEINSAIERDNTSAYNYRMRAVIEYQLGHTTDFIKDCLKMGKYEEGDQVGIGTAMLANCESDELRNEIIAEIEKVRTASNGYYQLEADLLYYWGHYPSASSIYKEIISLGIDDANTYCYMADCQKNMGEELEAYTTASQGLDKYADNIALKYMKASTAIDLGKCDDALDTLNSLITESPETADLYCEKGRAYLTMGKYAEACEPLATAVALEPSATNKRYYADALRLSGNAEKATAQYNDILGMSEEDITKQGPNPQVIYASAYSGLGNRAAAIKAINAFQADTYSLLAHVYARLGDKDMTFKSLEEAYKNGMGTGAYLLHAYDFYWLHTDPDFAKLLAEHGVRTELNPDTKLLEYVPEGWYQSMGGRSLEGIGALKTTSPQDWVKKMNALCPLDYGSIGLLSSVGYNEKTKTYIYNFTAADEYGKQVYELSKNPKLKEIVIDKLVLDELLTSREEVKTEISYGIKTKHNYETADGNNKCSFTLTPKKLQQLLNECQTPDDIDIKSLENLAAMHNATASDGSKISLEGKWCVWTIIIPEDGGIFYNIELGQDIIKKQIEQSLSADPASKATEKVLVRQNIGMKYVYRGDKNCKTVEIVFTPEELNNLINK